MERFLVVVHAVISAAAAAAAQTSIDSPLSPEDPRFSPGGVLDLHEEEQDLCHKDVCLKRRHITLWFSSPELFLTSAKSNEGQFYEAR